jgi:hypothetical protein
LYNTSFFCIGTEYNTTLTHTTAAQAIFNGVKHCVGLDGLQKRNEDKKKIMALWLAFETEADNEFSCLTK